VDGKDKAIAADPAECRFKEFSPGPFGLKSACGAVPTATAPQTLKHISGNVSDFPNG
jgi:hypothetical protein